MSFRRLAERMRRPGWWRALALLALALAAAGCHWLDGGDRPGMIYGRAQAELGGVLLPLSDVRVAASGATNAVTHTRRDGGFTLARLNEGPHTVQLQALHGTYHRSVFVHGKHELPFVVKPADISAALFFELSGLKRVDVDDDGRLFWYYGELGAGRSRSSRCIWTWRRRLRRWTGARSKSIGRNWNAGSRTSVTKSASRKPTAPKRLTSTYSGRLRIPCGRRWG